jgi:hypothetical protein
VSGGSQLNQHVANLNLMLRLTDHFVLVPALRVEKQDTDSISAYDSPAAPFSSFPYKRRAIAAPGLSRVSKLRYTGLTNWVLYARANWLEGSGIGESWDNLELAPRSGVPPTTSDSGKSIRSAQIVSVEGLVPPPSITTKFMKTITTTPSIPRPTP